MSEADTRVAVYLRAVLSNSKAFPGHLTLHPLMTIKARGTHHPLFEDPTRPWEPGAATVSAAGCKSCPENGPRIVNVC